jgi:hypothetical protein
MDIFLQKKFEKVEILRGLLLRVLLVNYVLLQ